VTVEGDRPRTAGDALARFDEAFLEPEPDPTTAPPPATFAERALGQPPSPLERIDHLFHQTSRRVWLGVVALAILVGAGVLWTAVADRVITAESAAVILPPEGVFTVAGPQTGQVAAVGVAVGDHVAAGQALGTIGVAGGAPVPVPSPIDGVVVVVDARVGEVVAAGSPLFVVAPADPEIVAIGLFPAGSVSALSVGQDASVTVNGISPDRYGRIEGHVRTIGELPISSSRLVQLTGDPSLANGLAQQGPLYEVTVALTPADTPSGLAWTRGDGPPRAVPIGALAGLSVVVDRQHLIEKAFR
jgi:hypothetical protein